MEDELQLSTFAILHTEVHPSNSICLPTSLDKDHSHTA